MKKILLPLAAAAFAFSACTSQEEAAQKEAEKKAMELMQKNLEATRAAKKELHEKRSEDNKQNGQK